MVVIPIQSELHGNKCQVKSGFRRRDLCSIELKSCSRYARCASFLSKLRNVYPYQASTSVSISTIRTDLDLTNKDIKHRAFRAADPSNCILASRVPLVQAVLGTFQKLVASKAHDHEGLKLLQSVIEFVPETALATYLPEVGIVNYLICLHERPGIIPQEVGLVYS